VTISQCRFAVRDNGTIPWCQYFSVGCGRCFRKSGDRNRLRSLTTALPAGGSSHTECMIWGNGYSHHFEVSNHCVATGTLVWEGIFIGIGDDALASPNRVENRSVCALTGPVVRPIEGRTTGSADYKSAVPVKAIFGGVPRKLALRTLARVSDLRPVRPAVCADGASVPTKRRRAASAALRVSWEGGRA
jgi:hypothetical protein